MFTVKYKVAKVTGVCGILGQRQACASQGDVAIPHHDGIKMQNRAQWARLVLVSSC
jgi:hypothetical protein